MDRTTKAEGKVFLNVLRLVFLSLPMGEIVGLIYYKITVTTECTRVLHRKIAVTSCTRVLFLASIQRGQLVATSS